jgi:hypothetical protein
MNARGYKVVPLLVIFALGRTAFAQPPRQPPPLVQQTSQPTPPANQPSGGYRVTLPTVARSTKNPLVTENQEPVSDEAAAEPGVLLQTYATPLEETVKPIYRLSPKQLWHQAVGFSRLSQIQRKRFLETGQPMVIDQDGVYLWRDLYSYTKGALLASFFDNKLDIGLYERRYVSPDTIITGRSLFDFGAERPGEGYLFNGGRQIFIGVRLDLGKVFKKRY